MVETEDFFVLFEAAYFIIPKTICVPKNGEKVFVEVAVLKTIWVYSYVEVEKLLQIIVILLINMKIKLKIKLKKTKKTFSKQKIIHFLF
jgi:hypothetical protein